MSKESHLMMTLTGKEKYCVNHPRVFANQERDGEWVCDLCAGMMTGDGNTGEDATVGRPESTDSRGGDVPARKCGCGKKAQTRIAGLNQDKAQLKGHINALENEIRELKEERTRLTGGHR